MIRTAISYASSCVFSGALSPLPLIQAACSSRDWKYFMPQPCQFAPRFLSVFLYCHQSICYICAKRALHAHYTGNTLQSRCFCLLPRVFQQNFNQCYQEGTHRIMVLLNIECPSGIPKQE